MLVKTAEWERIHRLLVSSLQAVRKDTRVQVVNRYKTDTNRHGFLVDVQSGCPHILRYS